VTGELTAGRPLTVVFATDSFKGSLTSVEVSQALADGWRRARPSDELLLAPLADGGEGTLVAIHAAGGWEWQESNAPDPLGRPVRARWLRSVDGRRAVVELAEASGLSRLTAGERDAEAASTLGTGKVLRDVLGAGVRHILLGIGGSATTDGGAGILVGLGARMRDERGRDLRPGGGPLARLARIETGGLDPRLADVDLLIASDVRTRFSPTGPLRRTDPRRAPRRGCGRP
jgi:glycerate kinase